MVKTNIANLKPHIVSEENSHCTRRYTEAQIIDECGCSYGLIHDLTSDELLKVRPCNYTDMVRIGPYHKACCLQYDILR